MKIYITGTTPSEWNSVIVMPKIKKNIGKIQTTTEGYIKIQNTKLKRYSATFLNQTQFGFRKGRPCIDSGITLKVFL
jgi:hypothetical protein